MSEMPMMNRHAQLIIRHIGFFVMVHFQYVYDGFREKNLFVLPKSGSSRMLMICSGPETDSGALAHYRRQQNKNPIMLACLTAVIPAGKKGAGLLQSPHTIEGGAHHS